MTVVPVSRLVGRNTSSEVLRSAVTILGSGFCPAKRATEASVWSEWRRQDGVVQ
jgi:hypothetical protein